ncbi:hypothetical protein JYU34_005784 [Plutella xylostella]|uniref:Uncharacterized protein n=1 Tax=Plutella xylostella TaxID=51655 RepID=A0ABQ7QU42_PLUXY|nr:hypothetical protein JYU34_010068 [Plutella xylostella]KAG7304956.1 hypothetical protein JYU34_010373 [Plutella xylostella]KAG7308568.1 hypothetical protein JYU34_005784 [Plutella xylostella]
MVRRVAMSPIQLQPGELTLDRTGLKWTARIALLRLFRCVAPMLLRPGEVDPGPTLLRLAEVHCKVAAVCLLEGVTRLAHFRCKLVVTVPMESASWLTRVAAEGCCGGDGTAGLHLVAAGRSADRL